MIVYNVTSKVDLQIAAEWLQWLKEEHIPDLVSTGCFTRATVYHLPELDDAEGITYAVQYHSPSKEGYNEYLASYAPAMRKKSTDRWGNRIVSFRTLMSIVH